MELSKPMCFTKVGVFSSSMGILQYPQSERLLAAVFVLILFAQNPPWPIWEYQSTVVALSLTLGLLLTTKSGLFHFRGSYFGFFSIVWCFLYFFLAHGLAGSFRLSSAVFALTLLLIFRSGRSTGALAFDLVSRAFAGMLLVSLIFWALWLLGLPLPSTPMLYGSWKGDDGTTQLDNYYLFIDESEALIKRFYGVFDEPGVIGTLAAFVLCGLRFNFNLKRTWILVLGGLFSWSLAFVVLSILGLILLRKRDKLYFFICVLLALGGGAALITSNLMPSDDSASLLLLYRIVNFSEHGISSRTEESLNNFFYQYIGSLKFLFGEGTNFFNMRPDLLSGQGAILYLVEYGLLGVGSLLMIYISIMRSNNASRFQDFSLLVVFFFSFLQRPHLMTPWQIVLFWMILCAWSESKRWQDIRSNRG